MMEDSNPNIYMMDNKACIPQEMTITNVKLANAYVPFQKFCSLYPPLEALMKGTAFPELFSPFMGKYSQKGE